MAPGPRNGTARWRAALSGRFVIREVLAEHAGSALYAGRSVEGGPVLEIRVLARAGRVSDESDTKAFQQAVESLRALNHPQIVPIIQHGWDDGCVWYATEHVPGDSLRDRLRAGPMEFGECTRVVSQVAGALDHAHRRGVVHGRLTPDDVWLDSGGWVRVTDFNVRDALGAEEQMSPYLAPEQQALARVSGTAADQWALAVIVYECLTGATPFGERTALEIARGQIPPPVVTPESGLPEHVDEVLRRALDPRSAYRFDGVLDFSTALERGAPPPLWSSWGGPPQAATAHVVLPEAPPRRWTTGLVIATATVGVAASLWWVWGSRGNLQRESGPTTPGEEIAVEPEPPPVIVVPPPRPRPERAEPVERVDPPATRTTEPTTLKRPEPARTSRPSPPVARNPSPARQPAPALPPSTPGTLIVNARPWGQVYLDGELVGNTPINGLSIPAGTHRIRILRSGFEPYDQTITVPPGDQVRLTGIVLRELR